jgi:hypothetical protein
MGEGRKSFDFAGVYPDKSCARRGNVAPVARNVSRHKSATLATPLYKIVDLVSRIWCYYDFPEIKSSELRIIKEMKYTMISNMI